MRRIPRDEWRLLIVGAILTVLLLWLGWLFVATFT